MRANRQSTVLFIKLIHDVLSSGTGCIGRNMQFGSSQAKKQVAAEAGDQFQPIIGLPVVPLLSFGAGRTA